MFILDVDELFPDDYVVFLKGGWLWLIPKAMFGSFFESIINAARYSNRFFVPLAYQKHKNDMKWGLSPHKMPTKCFEIGQSDETS